MSKRIKIVLPDTGPLISLAHGNALDLLLSFQPEVEIILTDVVNFEATHRNEDFEDAAKIAAFLQAHQERIQVIGTTIGSLALKELERMAKSGQSAVKLPPDLGELSITNFIISLGQTNPGDPMLVIIEDEWFTKNAYAVPGNVHLLSTSAWLDGLEKLGVIESAAAIRTKIQSARPKFNTGFSVDRPAEKIEPATDWHSIVDRPKG